MYRPPKIISFIGYITGAIPLVSLPPNLGKLVWAEVVIVVGVAGAVCAIYPVAYDMIIQDGPPGRVMHLSLAVVVTFGVSYGVCRTGILRKAKGISRNRSLIVATVATTIAGLVLVAVAYPYPMDPERPSGDDLIFRLNTTEGVWVIEAKRADDHWPVEVERDTVYLASATIASLATFGSLVTIRILGTPKTRAARKWGAVVVFSGVGGVIFYQIFLMHIACCSTINAPQFAGFLWLTAAALMSIALGCGLIIDSGFKDEEVPSRAP